MRPAWPPVAEAGRRLRGGSLAWNVMTSEEDPAVTDAEVIALFEPFCRNVCVEVVGGIGPVERETGLPVGMRAFRCPYASGWLKPGMNLEEVARGFYEDNCRGCEDRASPGWLGETIATLADRRLAGREALQARERGQLEERRGPRAARSARRSRRSVGESYPSAAQLERVGRLDPADGPPHVEDLEWLSRTASLAPEVIADAGVGNLVELAGTADVPWISREAVQAVLVPSVAAERVPMAKGAGRCSRAR